MTGNQRTIVSTLGIIAGAVCFIVMCFTMRGCHEYTNTAYWNGVSDAKVNLNEK